MHTSTDSEQQLIASDGSPIESAKILDEFAAPRISTNAKSSEIGSCAWSPDGQYLAWSCGYRIVKVFSWTEYKNWKMVATSDSSFPGMVVIDAGETVRAIAFGSRSVNATRRLTRPGLFRYLVLDDVILATGLSNGRIRTWDVKTGVLLAELIDHARGITDLSFTSEGTLRLVSASLDGCLKVWDMEDDGNMMKTLWTKSKSVLGCCWSPNGKLAVSVGDYRSVLLWDMEKFTIIRNFAGHQHNVVKCCFSPDGALLATASYDTSVIIWDVLKGVPIKTLRHLLPAPSIIFAGGANGCYVRSVTFNPDGEHLGTVCDDGFVRLWNLSYPDSPVLATHVAGPLSCQFSPDGSKLAVGTIEGKVVACQSFLGIPSLKHICRLSIRRQCPMMSVEDLDMLPRRLRQYLRYDLF